MAREKRAQRCCASTGEGWRRPDQAGIKAVAAKRVKRGEPRHYKSTEETRYRSAGDGLGDVLFAYGGAVLEEAAGGQEFGVEQGGTGCAADQVVREQR